MTTNPFSVNKFEHGRKNLYFLLPGLLEKLESKKPIYLVGSRGTGKTTLLKAMSWRERLNNENLQRVVDGPITGDYIGVYLKAPSMQTNSMESWLTRSDTRFYAPLFSHYLDLVWLQEAFEGVWALGKSGYLDFDTRAEASAADQVLRLINQEDTRLGFRGMIGALRERRVSIESHALLNQKPEFVVELLEITQQISSFGLEASKIVSEQLANGLNFKVCIDESEEFTNDQQLIINSIVRNAEHPFLPVFSYVREPNDPHSTLFDSLKLQADDRRILPLERELQGAEFSKLCEGITRTRLSPTNTDEPEQPEFTLRSFLGLFDANAHLRQLLERSVSGTAKALLSRSEELAAHPFFPEAEEADALPIYQAYLIDKLDIDLEQSSSGWVRRGQESAQLRKRKVSAYLSITDELGYEPEYYGSDLLLQLCDGCVRDYLHQMNCIVEDASISPDEISVSQAPKSSQISAIARASHEKRDRMQEAELSIISETERLVDGLGRIMSAIQRRSTDGRHLRSSERGKFVWLYTRGPGKDRVYQILTEACETGYLKLLDQTDEILRFRVHTSMAAHYGFSYRGAYYDVKLEGFEIENLSQAQNEDQLSARVADIVQRLDGDDSGSLSLFDDAV